MITLHSPVFEIDQYWLIGHGHSSYRFIAEQHLATITGGISRSLYSFPLTAWYDAGPIGLLLWGCFFVQLTRRIDRIRQTARDEDLRYLAIGLSGSSWGLLVASLFAEIPYAWRLMSTYYLATAVCLCAERVTASAVLIHVVATEPGAERRVA
jgi:hypothetical protein